MLCSIQCKGMIRRSMPPVPKVSKSATVPRMLVNPRIPRTRLAPNNIYEINAKNHIKTGAAIGWAGLFAQGTILSGGMLIGGIKPPQ